MKRQQQGIRSTKKAARAALKEILESIELKRDIHPPKEPHEDCKQNHLFLTLGYLDPKEGTIYGDLTGNFPMRSLDGMVSVFILYDWTSNAILAEPVANTKDKTLVAIFKDKVEYLTKRGFKPAFNILDNVAPRVVHAYLESKDIKIQLVEPHNHQVNAAERAVQTFKNLFLLGLGTADQDFPLLL